MKNKSLYLLGLLFSIVGCKAEGHRTLEIKFMGNNLLSVEDTIEKNSENKDEYKSGFDDDSSFVEWLFGNNTQNKSE